ncbi:CoA-transferase family III [Epithele typhae]|uniref:CoA-transferase family III n=1 Tax=Epithele typhae TaxID=378194 RepID=UPI002008E466|nr:CoA-transferase family III [Epithele typhae]KAH9945255.1 CoA-transferase family III [Epithele typhae]
MTSPRCLPLAGIRVVEFAGLAPGPMAGMILADFGADVVRVDRMVGQSAPAKDVLARGKRSIAVDPKTKGGYGVLRKLIEGADVLIDPFRPGVLERLNLGPDLFLGESGSNKKLIYARLVGFPREGPHKNMAGHDLNYLALSGVLSMLPGEGKPEFPLNIMADFAAGGLMCATGILLALMERSKSGLGQIVNSDMTSGVRYMSTFPLLLWQLNTGHFGKTRSTGLLDGAAPFYAVYTCADGRWMSVACLEPQFFAEFLALFLSELSPDFSVEGWRPSADDQPKRDTWLRMKEFFARGFAMKPRNHWAAVFHGKDACAVPVLSPDEAATLAGQTWKTSDHLPVPHPNLSTTPSIATSPPGTLSSHVVRSGAHTDEILRQLGMGDEERAALRREGAIGGRIESKL